MSGALAGTACGMLAAAAVFGLVGRSPHQRGARMAGWVGAAVLLAALLAHAAALSSPLSFFNAPGRALCVAAGGLLAAGLAGQRTSPASLWWCFGLASLLAGWAELAASNTGQPPPASLLSGVALLAAAAICLPAAGQALASLTASRPSHTGMPDAGRRMLIGSAAIVLLVTTMQGIHKLAIGSFWPPAFKSSAATWLMLLASCLVYRRPGGAWLVIVSSLTLIVTALSPAIWNGG